MKKKDIDNLARAIDSAYTLLLDARQTSGEPAQDDLEFMQIDLMRALTIIEAELDEHAEREDSK